MSKTVSEALAQLKQLNYAVQSVISEYDPEGECIIVDTNDPNELFLRQQIREMIENLSNFSSEVTYLSKPVVEEGVLSHNEDGRYALPSGSYFTSSSVCEILHYDTFYERWVWSFTSIEHNGDDYYATVLGRDHSIAGITARVRR